MEPPVLTEASRSFDATKTQPGDW